jgi:hypothetical protein
MVMVMQLSDYTVCPEILGLNNLYVEGGFGEIFYD